MMTDKIYPQTRRNGLVVQEMPDEVLVYDLDSSKAHCLNDSAAVVWRACDGSHSIADIVKTFEKTSGSKVTEDFVWLAIDQLNDNGLLEAGTAKRFAGQSRRDVLKKIGLASMIALPVIASLVAPQNALASVSCTCSGGSPGNPNPSGDAFCQLTAPSGCPMLSCSNSGSSVCI